MAIIAALSTGCGASSEEAISETAAMTSEGSDNIITAEETTTTVSETMPSADVTAEEIKSESYTIASLKGPTTMGMIKLTDDSASGLTYNSYDVSIHGAADEIVAGIVSGSTDIANVPANLASVLYKKTEGAVMITDVNTLGVLYVVTSGESISSVEELRGKTVYSTGKGTTPEYVFNYILRQNGLEPQQDVIIEYRSEASEVAAIMAESESGIAVLPQPYVTSAKAKNNSLLTALSLTEEWDKVCDTPLITGVTIAQTAAINRNTDAFDIFLDEYKASVEFVNSDPDSAAALIGKYDIVKEDVAKAALPECNITFLRGEEMKKAVTGYLNVLFEADPASVGGALPDETAFYLS